MEWSQRFKTRRDKDAAIWKWERIKTAPPKQTDTQTRKRTYHELPCEVLGRGRLQRVKDDVSVQRIPGHDAPVVEHLRAERLPLQWRFSTITKQKNAKGRTIRNQKSEGKKKLHFCFFSPVVSAQDWNFLPCDHRDPWIDRPIKWDSILLNIQSINQSIDPSIHQSVRDKKNGEQQTVHYLSTTRHIYQKTYK